MFKIFLYEKGISGFGMVLLFMDLPIPNPTMHIARDLLVEEINK